jgi:hypothetical protein
MNDTEAAATPADAENIVSHIAAAYGDRAGEVLAGILVNAIGHYLTQPGADSFVAALNLRLAEIAEQHGRKPFVLVELGLDVPPRH